MEAKAETHLARMEALLGLRPWGEVTEVCPENLKAGPEKMEVAVLEANPEAMEAIVEWQELCNEEVKVDTIGSLEGRHMDWHLVVRWQ
jgi:hypothetical protein